jgi:hypothetical protein
MLAAAAVLLAAAAELLDKPLAPGWPAALIAAGAASLLHVDAHELVVTTPIGPQLGRRIARGLALAVPSGAAVVALCDGGALQCAALLAPALAFAARQDRVAAAAVPLVLAPIPARETLAWIAVAAAAALYASVSPRRIA